MEERKTMDSVTFWLRHLAYVIVIGLNYYNLLFINLPGKSVGVSKLVLFVGLPAVAFFLCYYTRRKYATELVALANSALPYTVYFFITSFSVYNKLMCAFLVIAVVLCVACICVGVFRKVKNKVNIKKIICNRIRFAVMNVRVIAGVLGFVLLIVSGISSFFGVHIMSSDVSSLQSAACESSQEWTISNQIETVKLLQEDEWKRLDTEERLDVLGVIRNIELNYLGIPHEVYLSADVIDENLAGYYNSKEHRIVVSVDFLASCSAKEALDTICHEMYHAYTHSQVDLYKSLPEEYKGLLMFDIVRIYEEEFNDYISSGDDTLGYMYQYVEINANKYAKASVDSYYAALDNYFSGTAEKDEHSQSTVEQEIQQEEAI